MTTTSAPPRSAGSPRRRRCAAACSRLWDRKLPHYPETGPRSLYLAITVLATVVLYYELYVGGAVATQIIAEFDFSFTSFVFVSVDRQRWSARSPRCSPGSPTAGAGPTSSSAAC